MTDSHFPFSSGNQSRTYLPSQTKVTVAKDPEILKVCTQVHADDLNTAEAIDPPLSKQEEYAKAHALKKKEDNEKFFEAVTYNALVEEFINYSIQTYYQNQKKEEIEIREAIREKEKLADIQKLHFEDIKTSAHPVIESVSSQISNEATVLLNLIAESINQVKENTKAVQTKLDDDLAKWEEKERTPEKLAKIAKDTEEKTFNVKGVFTKKDGKGKIFEDSEAKNKAKEAFGASMAAKPPAHKLIKHITPIREAIEAELEKEQHAAELKAKNDGVPPAPFLEQAIKIVKKHMNARDSLITHIHQIGALRAAGKGIKDAIAVGRGILNKAEREILDQYYKMKDKIQDFQNHPLFKKVHLMEIRNPNIFKAYELELEREQAQKSVMDLQEPTMGLRAQHLIVGIKGKAAINELNACTRSIANELNAETRSANPLQVLSDIGNSLKSNLHKLQNAVPSPTIAASKSEQQAPQPSIFQTPTLTRK